MGCACKNNTPLNRLETRLRSRGWAGMSASDYKFLANFIKEKLGVEPKDDQEIQILYPQAKKV
jgi:hypothetical protein